MKMFKLSFCSAVLLAFALLTTGSSIYAGSKPPSRIFLPIIERKAQSGYGTENKFIGIYMDQYWTDVTVPLYMAEADTLAEKKHAVTGWFISLQNIAFTERQNNVNVNNFYRQMEALWKKGYVSFINLNSATEVNNYEVTDNCPIPFSAYQVARGDCNSAIQKMAELYSQWVSLGGGRRAFIAPLPEMNGVNSNGLPWTSYGGDPVNFILAYRRILDIFSQAGVGRDQVWWTFAPNGWSKAGHEFELYYPGDSNVNVVGFSMYNYGWCSVAHPWEKWENYDTLYEPYISRIQVMAPGKPVVIAQTGTTDQYLSKDNHNTSAKNIWLATNYEYLANQPAVLGVIYFDLDKSPWECNWKITVGNTFKPGYSEAAAYPAFQYLDWQDLLSIIP